MGKGVGVEGLFIGGQVQLILAGRSTPETLVTDGQKSYDEAAAKRG